MRSVLVVYQWLGHSVCYFSTSSFSPRSQSLIKWRYSTNFVTCVFTGVYWQNTPNQLPTHPHRSTTIILPIVSVRNCNWLAKINCSLTDRTTRWSTQLQFTPIDKSAINVSVIASYQDQRHPSLSPAAHRLPLSIYFFLGHIFVYYPHPLWFARSNSKPDCDH